MYSLDDAESGASPNGGFVPGSYSQNGRAGVLGQPPSPKRYRKNKGISTLRLMLIGIAAAVVRLSPPMNRSSLAIESHLPCWAVHTSAMRILTVTPVLLPNDGRVMTDVLLRCLQFALVLLWSVLASNKPGMDPHVRFSSLIVSLNSMISACCMPYQAFN